MDSISSKPSRTYFLGMGVMVALSIIGFVTPEETIPIWVGIVFSLISILLVFGIKTTTFFKDEIRVKFIAGRKEIILKKEDIDVIEMKQEAYSTAQRVGMMKKDVIIQIKAKESKRIISVVEKFDKQFKEIHDFLQEHYKDCWERGAGEVM